MEEVPDKKRNQDEEINSITTEESLEPIPKDEGNEERKCCTRKLILIIILYLIIIIIVFTILGIIISYAHSNKKGLFAQIQLQELFHFWPLDVPAQTSSDGIESKKNCSANSFLIGDGVCDEVTNNERCLFDNGDCCLDDDESKKYCTSCQCNLAGS